MFPSPSAKRIQQQSVSSTRSVGDHQLLLTRMLTTSSKNENTNNNNEEPPEDWKRLLLLVKGVEDDLPKLDNSTTTLKSLVIRVEALVEFLQKTVIPQYFLGDNSIHMDDNNGASNDWKDNLSTDEFEEFANQRRKDPDSIFSHLSEHTFMFKASSLSDASFNESGDLLLSSFAPDEEEQKEEEPIRQYWKKNFDTELSPRIHKALTLFALKALPHIDQPEDRHRRGTPLSQKLITLCSVAKTLNLTLPFSIHRRLLQHSVQQYLDADVTLPSDELSNIFSKDMVAVHRADQIKDILEALPNDMPDTRHVYEEDILKPMLSSQRILWLAHLVNRGRRISSDHEFFQGNISPPMVLDIIVALRNFLFGELEKIKDCWDNPKDPKVVNLMETVVPEVTRIGEWLDRGCDECFQVQTRDTKEALLWKKLDDDDHLPDEFEEELKAFYDKIQMHIFSGPGGIFGSQVRDENTETDGKKMLLPPKGLRSITFVPLNDEMPVDWDEVAEDGSEIYQSHQSALDMAFSRTNEKKMHTLDWRRLWSALIICGGQRLGTSHHFVKQFVLLADPQADPNNDQYAGDRPVTFTSSAESPFDQSSEPKNIKVGSTEDGIHVVENFISEILSRSDNYDSSADGKEEEDSDDDALSMTTSQNEADELSRWSIRWEEDEVPDVWQQLCSWNREADPSFELHDDSADPLIHLTPHYRKCIHRNFESGKTPAAIRQMKPWD